jgi:hypothetical protein
VSSEILVGFTTERYDFSRLMSDIIQSAEELFDLLAGDEQEVPSTLLRGSKSVSRHEKAMIEQQKLEQLNRVEKWMNKDGAVESDPPGFISLGETLCIALLNSKRHDLTLSLVQKLTKLVNLWLKVSKSCKLVEPNLEPSHIIRLLDRIKKSHSPQVSAQETCGRVLLAMVQSSPCRLFRDREVIEAFNKFVAAWCRGTFRGNGLAVLKIFPLEFLVQLDWPFSPKPFVAGKVNELIVRLLKKGLEPRFDQNAYVKSLGSIPSEQKKELEELFIKLMGAVGRSKTVVISEKVLEWIKEVSARDQKKPGVSVKNIRLAADLLKQLEK